MTERRFTRVLGAIKEQREKVPDTIASETPDLYPTMKFDRSLIKVGTRINWNGQLKRALVDLWDAPENSPDVAPVYWHDLVFYKGYRVIPSVFTAILAFSLGEIGYWPPHDKFYKSLLAVNVYDPDAYMAGWEEVAV